MRGEVETLAYPKTALFGLAVSVYNLLQVVRHAAQRAGAAPNGAEVSPVLLAQEVGSYGVGLGPLERGTRRCPPPRGTRAGYGCGWTD